MMIVIVTVAVGQLFGIYETVHPYWETYKHVKAAVKGRLRGHVGAALYWNQHG